MQNSEELKENLIFIDKPKGITSFDVIRQLRQRLNIRKMGHAGTLDPLATGLLIVGINKGTKRMHEILGLSKVYLTEVLLGVQTDTGDMEGKILAEASAIHLKEKEISRVVKSLEGDLELAVPAYSAVKVSGKPLYKRVREGEVVKPPVKIMKVLGTKLLGIHEQDNHVIVEVEMKVGSGVYIRSVAEELGRRLSVPATVYELRRTSIGDFKVSVAKKIEDF